MVPRYPERERLESVFRVLIDELGFARKVGSELTPLLKVPRVLHIVQLGPRTSFRRAVSGKDRGCPHGWSLGRTGMGLLP